MNSSMIIVTVNGSRFLLNLLALTLIVGAIIIQPAEQAPVGKGVKLIRNELDQARKNGAPSFISFDNLEEAYSESDEFSDMKITVDLVNEVKERRPTIQLTIDLLVAMSDQYNSIVNGNENSLETQEEFIKRLEVFYSTLYGQYLNMTTYERPCVKSSKADDLIYSIIEDGDSQPLSRKLIQEAKEEYDEQVLHFNEIKSTDLPQEAEQLDARVNYLNLDETQLLVRLVFPLLEQPDPIDFAELRYNFTDATEQLNYKHKLIDISAYKIANDDFDLEETFQQAADSPEAVGVVSSS